MIGLSTEIPLSDHRARVARYLRGIDFSFVSVAGRIIEERLPLQYVRDAVRPGLVLWACAANKGDLADAVPVAAAFDLFDRFRLLHDELMMGSAAAQARWGLGQSLNAGDALCAIAFHTLASDVRNPGRRLEAARLAGEAVLIAIERRDDDGFGDAALTGAAMQAGAVIGGASERVVQSFARAGRLLAAAQFAHEAGLARRYSRQAFATISRYASGSSVAEFEEVVRYVAQRAA
jgi:hypothetical protein